MDRIKINEQNKSIATQPPFYVHSEFKVIRMLLPEDVADLNPMVYRIS